MAETLALDTNCVIAALCAWHPHHHQASDRVRRERALGTRLVIASHSMVEVYAVLTRLPPPHRLAPADAVYLLTANAGLWQVAPALPVDRVWQLLQNCAAQQTLGGQVYDAVIAQTVKIHGAAAILTLNLRHFEPFRTPDFAVLAP